MSRFDHDTQETEPEVPGVVHLHYGQDGDDHAVRTPDGEHVWSISIIRPDYVNITPPDWDVCTCSQSELRDLLSLLREMEAQGLLEDHDAAQQEAKEKADGSDSTI